MNNLAAVILNDAKSLLEDEGWVQDATLKFTRHGEPGVQIADTQEEVYGRTDIKIIGRCADGAIEAAAYNLEENKSLELSFVHIDEARIRARYLLACQIFNPIIAETDEQDQTTINNWNDEDERTFEEVMYAFDEAQSAAENEV